ncbi:MAG: MATE family efflux transporter [Oscillospiraceae bacterium]
MDLLKRFFKFVIPSIVSMWVFSLYSMVDGMYVAHGVGPSALAAVNLSMPYTAVIFTVGLLFATGTSTVISIALGKKDLPTARHYFNQNLVVVGIVSIIFTILTLIFLDPIAHFLGATPSTLTYVKEYVGTISVFFVFFTVSYNLEVQVKADGAPQISTIGVISCAIMNIVLDYVFVIAIPWGVFGAAFATGLSQMTSTTVFVIYFLTHKERLRLQKFKPHLADYRRILPLGLSDGLTELSNGIVIFAFNHTIMRVIGESAVVTYTIISYVNTLVLMTMTGTTQGIQPLTSYYYGAGERKTCHRLLKYGLCLVTLFSAVSFLIGQGLAEPIVRLFLDSGDPLIPASVSALQQFSFAFLILGFNVIIAGFFTAVERPVYSVTISFGRGLVLVVGSLLAVAAVFGEAGVWYSTLLSEALCLFVTGFFLLRYRRSLRLEAPEVLAVTCVETDADPFPVEP